MGVEKQEKRKRGEVRSFACCRLMAIGTSLLVFLYLAGCVKTVPQRNTPAPESTAPAASQIDQQTMAEAPTGAEATVPSTVKPEEEAVKEEAPAP